MNSRVNNGTRIKEVFFFSSRMFKKAKLLELLNNGNNKDHRRIFHEFRVGISVELLELPSNRGKLNEVDRSYGCKEC